MNENDKKIKRSDELFTVLQYDSYGEKTLTDFDRMFIHKEISAIIGGTDYKVPEYLEDKIQAVLHLVQRMNWKSPFYIKKNANRKTYKK